MFKNLLLAGLSVAMLSGVGFASKEDVTVKDDPSQTGDVAINEKNFPDDLFREYVATSFDSNGDGKLDEDERGNVQSIDLYQQEIYSVQGIEFFTNLRFLGCQYLKITKLDLSHNTGLSTLTCYENDLRKLDVSMCQELYSLDCSANSINELILCDSPNLREFSCARNMLSSVDVSKFPAMTSFDCSENNIASLDVSGNPYLKTLNCSQNRIVSLDVSQNKLLTTLNCSMNNLSEVDLSQNRYLETLFCYSNAIKTLDLSSCKYLEELQCSNNQFETLDISKCAFIEAVDCSFTNITSCDISDLDFLSKFYCEGGQVKSVSVHNCASLKELFVRGNAITKFDVSDCPSLEYIGLEANKLSSLDVSKIPNLYFLNVNDNQLKSIDLSHNPKLHEIWCEMNSLIKLDMSHNPQMEYVNCMNNQIAELDLSHNPKMLVLECSGNPINKLDLSHCPKLSALFCECTGITSLDLSKSPEMINLSCYGCDIKKLDIRPSEIFVNLVQKAQRQEDESGTYYYYILDPDGEPIEGASISEAKPQDIIVDCIYLAYPKETQLIYQGDEATPAPEKGEGGIGDFVERLYTVALGRESEAKGKQYWIDEITSGRKTGGDCGLFFLTGEEFTNRNLSVEDFVETLYKTFFGRESEPAGKAYWVGVLKSGGDRTGVVRGFIDSKEWCNLCADYGVRSGAPSAKAERASKNAIEFVKRLFTYCFGRAADQAGLQYWSLALTNLEQTGASAAKEFFCSQEFKNMKTTDEDYVTRLYQAFMDRKPEQGGLDYWVGQLKAGTSREKVLAQFAVSQEFTDICARYGIERGSL